MIICMMAITITFEIYDYYGNAVYTDFVMFGIETDEIGNVELFYY